MTRLAIAVAATFLAAHPVTFAWPTSVAVAQDGSVLVVENGTGRVLEFPAHGGAPRIVARGLAKAYAVATAPGGALVVSADGAIFRLSGGTRTVLAPRSTAAGPIAVDASGRVVYATETGVFRLPKKRLAVGLAGPHGIAVARDGSVLVSDTGHGRVLRIARDGRVSTLIRVANPRGLDVARDGTILVVEPNAHRVGRYDARGARIGTVAGGFGDPYDVAEAADGTVYVVDTAAVGHVRTVPR